MYPVFVTDSSPTAKEPIEALPEQHRVGVDVVCEFVRPLVQKGLRAILLFAVVTKPEHKDGVGSFGDSPQNPVVLALRKLRVAFPELLLACDVCLCTYTDHGHCGIFEEGRQAQGRLDHSGSSQRLAEIATALAQAGADVVAPSDMMDGRVLAIKEQLKKAKMAHVAVMSYVKAASKFYGPFRDAAGSAPSVGPKDRKMYQLPPGSSNLFVQAALTDIKEGADLMLVKPALTYADCIHRVKTHPDVLVPVAAYQVSGEYAMLYHASCAGAFQLEDAIVEAFACCKRAGADVVITYFAPRLLDLL